MGGDSSTKEIFKRESGNGLDIWVDAIDLCFNACREQIKDSKAAEERVASAMPMMKKMHEEFVKQRGHPEQAADRKEAWSAWFQYFTSNNYDRTLIEQLYAEVHQLPTASGVTAKPAAKGKVNR